MKKQLIENKGVTGFYILRNVKVNGNFKGFEWIKTKEKKRKQRAKTQRIKVLPLKNKKGKTIGYVKVLKWKKSKKAKKQFTSMRDKHLAFNKLHKEYFSKVFNWAKYKVTDYNEAYRIAVEAFTKVGMNLFKLGNFEFNIEHKDIKFKNYKDLKNYLYSAVNRLIIDYYKSIKTQKRLYEILNSDTLTPSELDGKVSIHYLESYMADYNILEKEINLMLKNVISDFSEDKQKVFEMYFKGYTGKQIEKETGFNQNKIRTTIHRAKEQIKASVFFNALYNETKLHTIKEKEYGYNYWKIVKEENEFYEIDIPNKFYDERDEQIYLDMLPE